MHDSQNAARIHEAPHIAAPNVPVRHVVAAPRYAFANPLNTALGTIDTDVNEPDEESAFERRPDHGTRPSPGERLSQSKSSRRPEDTVLPLEAPLAPPISQPVPAAPGSYALRLHPLPADSAYPRIRPAG